MNKIFFLGAFVFPLFVNAQKEKTELKTFQDSVAYAIGTDIAESVKQLNVDYNMLVKGILDYSQNKNTFTKEDIMKVLNEFQNRQQKNQMAEADKNIEIGKKFLTENRNNKSVYETKSGLQYKIVKQGKGKKPTANDKVKFHYTGTLIDGTKFDSSYDRGEPITDQLSRFIPGWVEGLQLMDEGSKFIFYIPSNLGYGNQSAGQIPPGSALIFEVELLEVVN